MTMPNFFIVGAQKAGTTSLYYYLKQHPQIYMSPRKEPHFFEGMHWDFYRPGRMALPVTDLADYQALFEGVTDEKAIGEASASYLYSPKAPTLIKRSIPYARLIAILRNPADRAYSNFLHCVRAGRESIVDFAEALRVEEGRIKGNWGPLWHYKQKGFYYAQVKRYLDTFGRDPVQGLALRGSESQTPRCAAGCTGVPGGGRHVRPGHVHRAQHLGFAEEQDLVQGGQKTGRSELGPQARDPRAVSPCRTAPVRKAPDLRPAPAVPGGDSGAIARLVYGGYPEAPGSYR